MDYSLRNLPNPSKCYRARELRTYTTRAHHPSIEPALKLPESSRKVAGYWRWFARFFGIDSSLESRLQSIGQSFGESLSQSFGRWFRQSFGQLKAWSTPFDRLGRSESLSRERLSMYRLCRDRIFRDRLGRDLAALAARFEQVESASTAYLPPLSNYAVALGTLSFIEGSNLDSRFILKGLSASLGEEIAEATSFFAGYGAQMGYGWNWGVRLLERLFSQESTECQHVCAGTLATFSSHDACMSPSPERGEP